MCNSGSRKKNIEEDKKKNNPFVLSGQMEVIYFILLFFQNLSKILLRNYRLKNKVETRQYEIKLVEGYENKEI